MGNICSGGKEEAKPAALDVEDMSNVVVDDIPVATMDSPSLPQNALTPAEHLEQNRLLRKEQARQDLIVQAAGRSMVPVRNTRGSNYLYNDQGFGAALAQHLQDTLGEEAMQNPHPLPPAPPSKIMERLTAPFWSNVELGTKGTGLAGCDGENPLIVLDRVAESYLASKKERILHDVLPMVESLL